jgi:hypothetical protein
MENGYISGINPSIAKLVYLLNFWGATTYGSHASFYPGDPEEQEYWVQKQGIKEDHHIDISGPIVLWGVFLNLPSVLILVIESDVNKIKKLLPEYWVIKPPPEHLNKSTEFQKAFKIVYQHPKLMKFQIVWDDLCRSLDDKLNLSERSDMYHNANWELGNETIEGMLPISSKEFNIIRDEGLKSLENRLLHSISEFNPKRYKKLVDDYIVKLNLFHGYSIGYFER